ncbi:DinB family protein [Paenisporosarcina sp. FSL H8-0542]|uniref:DinB family protein n=1 Tax=Paenisporosarcina sp. FSL H8-0542 TaxID=2921401 RepID=UPI00315AB000
MNQTEYEWVKQTREIVFDFCSELEPDDFTRQVDGFGFQSIRDSLVHISDCYYAWLGSYILLKTKKPLTVKEDLSEKGLDEIKVRFNQVDAFVNEVFEVFSNQMDVPIEREIPWRVGGEIISMTPAKLLMHVITHEFHHKGQIVAMARQMGYEPPNTDVLGTRG